VADMCLFAHGFSPEFLLDRIFECINQLDLPSLRHSSLASLAVC
jgi:hypothetical protein